MANNNDYVRVEKLSKHFQLSKNQTVHALDDVSFNIAKGETLGIVGESGCGKSTLGRTLVGLYQATQGTIHINGQNTQTLTADQRHSLHKTVQMIFQDPYASLNPRATVFDIIAEPLTIHFPELSKQACKSKVESLLNDVGLHSSAADRYPHEFSGGQRQRIGIARALALDPEFIVCDEPVSALDVSVQAQIANLLKKLQKEKNLSYLLIAHDLAIVKYLSNRIAVMYLGQIVEMTTSSELYKNPLHPYTQSLIAAIPETDPVKEKTKNYTPLQGEVPSPINPPEGCRFHQRCPKVQSICQHQPPQWRAINEQHFVACHLV